MDYDDDYATCAETFATFRLASEHHTLDAITARIGLAPVPPRPPRPGGSRPRTVWKLTSEGVLASRDTRRHIDWLLDRLEPHDLTLAALRQEGAKLDIFCYWVSASGHGGPMLSPRQLARLADLELTVGWDVYFAGDDTEDER